METETLLFASSHHASQLTLNLDFQFELGILSSDDSFNLSPNVKRLEQADESF
jgi:hypothetical protein